MTSPRAKTILSRLPAHLEAARPGKLLGGVVDALALDLDVLSARMAAVRRAHRLAEADELADLLLIAARHGLTEGELDIVFERFAKVAERLKALKAAATPAARDAAAEELLAIWGLDLVAPKLPLFALASDPGNLNLAATRLASAVTTATRYAKLLAPVRRRIAQVCLLHAAGNGTVDTVMRAAANAWDLQIDSIVHSPDRYWHAAPVTDMLRLDRQIPAAAANPAPATGEHAQTLPAAREFIGLEENPLWRMVTDGVNRRHAELWSLVRRGFERTLLQVRVKGADAGRSVGPMVVNRDEGHGIGYTASVPTGKTLVFTEEGRALLDGADVTSFAYAWQGACFAGTDSNARLDFVFGGDGLDPALRPAHFVTSVPELALDRETTYPHSGESLPVPGIAVGTTRLAYFVQQAHAGSLEGAPPAVRTVSPRTRAAVFDNSVFTPGTGQTEAVAGEVSLSWMERRAFAARLLIPPRFRALRDDDDVDGVQVLRRVSTALERFRPAGIQLTVEFIDDRWVLGQGLLPGAEHADAISQLRAATELWPVPAN